ncbi:MAG: YraN family protein [Patescibacteria group bacterium]|jgi:putative endonuclease
MDKRKNLGQYGENLAKEYLKRHDYQLIAANCRVGHKELDLIASRLGKIIFFEVKTRRSEIATPEDCLTKRQTNRLRSARQAYCYKNRLDFETVQGDLLIIIIEPQTATARIKHYARAF